MRAKTEVGNIAVLERFLRVFRAISTIQVASAKTIQQTALPDMSERSAQRYLNELTVAGYVTRKGKAGYRYFLTDKALGLMFEDNERMSSFQKCEHGYDLACLMCGFGTIDGRRMWSDWAMTRQRAAYDRHINKFIQIDAALKECAADDELTKEESIELISSTLNRVSKFEVGEEVVYIDPTNSGELWVITQVRKDGDYEVKTALRGWPVPTECWGFYPKEHEIRKATKPEKLVKKRVFENAFVHKSTGRIYTLLYVTNKTVSKNGREAQSAYINQVGDAQVVYKNQSEDVFSKSLAEFQEQFSKVNGSSTTLESWVELSEV